MKKILTFKVFNVEFEGIDKCGKDTLKQTMFKVYPNTCAYKARGILSQLAYNLLYNRDWQYHITEGYFQNSLFVYLDIDKEDWLKRLQDSNEIAENANRSDVAFVADYARHKKAFDDAWIELSSYFDSKYALHFLRVNTSELSAEEIAELVKQRLLLLNNMSDN